VGRQPLRRCCEPGLFFALLLCFDLGRLLLDQLDEVVDDVVVFEAVVGEAADIDLVGAVAAAGECGNSDDLQLIASPLWASFKVPYHNRLSLTEC